MLFPVLQASLLINDYILRGLFLKNYLVASKVKLLHKTVYVTSIEMVIDSIAAA